MKVLLIAPLAPASKTRWLPMGLGYISSILKQNGHDVILYDRYRKGLDLKDKDSVNNDMRAFITRSGPDLIGLSTVSPLIHDTAQCVGFISGFYGGTMIAGGHHATAMPETMLEKIPGLDLVAVGEAEYTMLGLAEGINRKDIPGLLPREEKGIVVKSAHISDLDELPLPDYQIFDMDYYTQANQNTIKGFYLKTACVLSSRGCPNNCSFCSESLTFGRGIRSHSADYVIENIEKLVADYNVEGIYFHDNNFLASPSRSEEVCRGLIRSGLSKKIKWEMQTGTSTLNDEILTLLDEAGCIKIELGIESIKETDLKVMNKRSDVDLNRKAVELCHKHGITVHTNFMTGFESETIQDLENKLQWIRTVRPHTFSMHALQVYPGTELYEKLGNSFFEKEEWTEENVQSFYHRQVYKGIKIEERRKWFNKVYRPFNTNYIRRSILRVNPLSDIIKIVFKKILRIK